MNADNEASPRPSNNPNEPETNPITVDNQTVDSQTANDKTADSQTIDSQTANDTTVDSQTVDSRTVDSRTADSQIANDKAAGNKTAADNQIANPITADSQTANSQTAESAQKPVRGKKETAKQILLDTLTAVIAGAIVACAYFFFQNSNGFAPGGVGGLATMTFHLCGGKVPWTYLMLIYNIPIFVLVTVFVNRKLGIYLIIYMLVQSFGAMLLEKAGAKAYCLANNGTDFEIVFACIATGVISGLGFSIMLRRFGASGGTYAISALVKRVKPATNVAYLSFWLDSSVVFLSFFVYGRKITPVLCTLINLFIANIVVDYFLSGLKAGYRFEIVTDRPKELAAEIITRLHHGATEIHVRGMYSDSNKYMVVCIIRKKEIGEMLKIIKRYPGTFADFSRVNEVFGRFHP